ncbi:DUF5801 repeats-in-toxin domain-containing protein, partial [Roseibium sp. SCP14]|uniref:DUF5801 repeats-in-toxin domain-containing protein n=1 Tax=Roseibium sp. SCP14 TaxID=3141375 RepID=UPI003335DE76
MSSKDFKNAFGSTTDELKSSSTAISAQTSDSTLNIDQSEAIDVAQATDVAPTDAATSETPGSEGEISAALDVVTANEQNQIFLPAGTSLDDVVISGDDLILLQPDGTEIIIRNAALNVPTFVIDGIEIPQEALVAALANSGIDIAAGPDGTLVATQAPDGAGGNFFVQPGGIGDAGPVLDLLGRTELRFPVLEQRELFPEERRDSESGNNPIGVLATSIISPDEVSQEAGIDQTPSQPAGSDELSDGIGTNDSSNLEESSTGFIIISAPDGIAELLINGVPVDLENPGTVIEGTHGFVTITSTNPETGEFEYFYTVTEAVDHPLDQDIVTETFTVEVTDNDGDTASTTFEVGILDDVPTVSVQLNTEVAAAVDEGDQDTGSPSTGVAAAIDTGSIAKGDDPDVANTGGAAIASATTAAALVDITTVFGADGEAAFDATQFKLSFSSNATGLSVTDGSAIILVDVNGDGSVIVGQVSGGSFNGQAAFALSIDPDTGVVTVEQYLSLAHPDQATSSNGFDDYDETVDLSASDLAVTVTVTDGDGDQAQASASVGDRFSFDDDGPQATLEPNFETSAVLDEGDQNDSSPSTGVPSIIDTGSIAKGDDPDVANTGGAAIASAVTSDPIVNVTAFFGADGPAAENSIQYALSFGSNFTGLTVTDGSAIVLVDVNGDGSVIVGQVSGGEFDGQAAFALAINPETGILTVEQYLSLDHPLQATSSNGFNSYDEGVSLASSDLQVSVIVTDGDGDQVVAESEVSDDQEGSSAFIGWQIRFEDDGPALSVQENSDAMITVDEGDQNAGSPSTGVPATIDTGSIIKGDDPDVANTGGVAIASAASGVALVDASVLFGADGPATEGSLTYAFTLDFGFTDLRVTDGSAITLVDVHGDGSVIVGQVVGGAFDGQAAFALSIDPGTGVVTVEQYLSLSHPDQANEGNGFNSYDEAVDLSNSGLAVKVTATDGDGDQSEASTSVEIIGEQEVAVSEIGGLIKFEDDGPQAAIDPEAELGMAVVDESSDVFTGTPGSGVDGIKSVTIGLAGNFIAPAYGADGEGTTAYALVLSAQDIGSGLFATDPNAVDGKGAEILLSQSSNVITGATGGDTYFTITIDPATGEVTFELENNAPIWHGDTDNHDDTSVLAIDPQDGTLVIRQTVTDADGDEATASINLGNNVFKVEDDGPKAEADSAATLDMAVVDESSDVFTGTPGSGVDGIKSVTIGLADNFVAPAYGADGEGTTAYALVLSAQDIGSGLFATDPNAVDGKGAEILLSQSGNVITGATGGDTYFTITIDPATGEVTFELENNAPIWHGDTDNHDDASILAIDPQDGTLVIRQTVTDADGDEATASINLGNNVFKVEDDGPKAEADSAATLDMAVVDESSDVFTGTPGSGVDGIKSVTIGLADNFVAPTYGADGEGTTAYALVLSAQDIGSGLFATDPNAVDGKGAEILLSQSGNVITGATGGDTYFTITIDPATGEVTFELENNAPIWHGDTDNHDDASILAIDPQDGTLVIRQTVTDADGDEAIASINLGNNVFKVEDDGPKAEADSAATLDMAVVDESSDVFTGTPGSGVDGIKSVTIGLADNFVAPAYGADGEGTTAYALVLSVQDIGSGLFATDPNAVDGKGAEILLSQSGNVITGATGGDTYFTITIDPVTGEVTFALENDAPIWHATAGDIPEGDTHPGSDHDDTSVLTIDPQDGTLVIHQTVTDSDGDEATASIDLGNNVFKVQDDGPTASDEALQNVAEGAILAGTFDFTEGADGATLTAIDGSPVSFNPDGWSNWLDLGEGDLRVKADGTYEFRADPVVANPAAPISGTFTITDSDGDTAIADFTFQITDANTPTGGSATAAVDDDGLPEGNAASTTGDLDADVGDSGAGLNDESLFVGTLGGSVGADGAGSNGFTWDTGLDGTSGTVGLENVTYTVTATTVTATVATGEAREGTVLYTATITDPATGAFEVQLVSNVLHAGGPNDEATDAIDNLTYIITDADGSSVGGNTLSITFDDDAPSAPTVTPTDGDAIMVQTYDGGLTDGNFTGNADGDGVPLVST